MLKSVTHPEVPLVTRLSVEVIDVRDSSLIAWEVSSPVRILVGGEEQPWGFLTLLAFSEDMLRIKETFLNFQD